MPDGDYKPGDRAQILPRRANLLNYEFGVFKHC
jgi:hypothetical protein